MRALAAVVAALLTLPAFAADPAPGTAILRVDRPSLLSIPGDTAATSKVLELPPVYILTDPAFAKLDTEVRNLQEQNRNLGESIASRPPGISVRGILTVFLVGAAAGAAVAIGGRALVDIIRHNP
jgi:hypothetical protein